MSPVSFNRFIKSLTGKTFVEYLNDTRISFATRWLIETDLSIGEIGLSVQSDLFKKSIYYTISRDFFFIFDILAQRSVLNSFFLLNSFNSL